MSVSAASFIRFTASSLGKSHRCFFRHGWVGTMGCTRKSWEMYGKVHSIKWLIIIFPKLMATNCWFLGAKSCEKSLLSDKRDGWLELRSAMIVWVSIILVGSHRYGDWQKTMVRVWELIYPPGWPWLHARYAHDAEKLVPIVDIHCGYPLVN